MKISARVAQAVAASDRGSWWPADVVQSLINSWTSQSVSQSVSGVRDPPVLLTDRTGWTGLEMRRETRPGETSNSYWWGRTNSWWTTKWGKIRPERREEIRDCPWLRLVIIIISAIRWLLVIVVITPHLITTTTTQLLPTLAANIGSFSAGLAVGFPAVLLRQLDHQLDHQLDQVTPHVLALAWLCDDTIFFRVRIILRQTTTQSTSLSTSHTCLMDSGLRRSWRRKLS